MTRRTVVGSVVAIAILGANCGSSSVGRAGPVPATRAPSPSSIPPPSRPAVAPVPTSPMPADAFVAVGSKLVAIDTRDPSRQRTVTEVPHAGINWITVDRPRGRVFFGVTSGCDPGVNGMYVMPLAGGARRKIAAEGARAAVSPDGARIAYNVSTDGCGTREIVVQEVGTGRRTVFTASRSVNLGAWSTDGRTMFFNTEGDVPSAYRFHPFVEGARLDDSPRWGSGIVADAGGGRLAVLDWCPPTASGGCVVGVRTRAEDATGPDASFGRVANIETMAIDTTGQWPLLIVDRRTTGDNSVAIVRLFANGKWRDLAPGNAADW